MHTHNGLWAHFEASETSEIAIGQGLPLSAQQTGIWLHSQLADEQGLYNLVYLRRFEQPLDDDAAQDAVRAIVRRHPVLQVRFGVADGEIQQTCGEVSVPWTIVALDGLDQTGQESRLAECLDDAGTYSFDLASGPLLKVDHLVLGGRQSALILSVHHICFDGLSIAVFEQEFDALYEAFKNKQQCDLPLPSMSYFDYCHAQQAQLSGQEFQRQLDYWRGQLDGLPAVHSLPLKASRPTGQSHRGEMHSAVLELEVSQQLRTLAETLNASLFEVVHALFATLVARHGNCADVVIGVPFAKRLNADGSGAGLAQLIGMFAEPMVLRVDCHAALSFADLVAAVREASMGALANSDVPFAVLVKELHEERADRTSPLFQIMLNMVDGTMYGGEGGGFQIVPSDLAKYDLNLYVSDPGDGVIGFHFNYNADLFDADWIATLQAHLLRLVESAVADPVENIYKLAMLNTQERAQLLAHGRTPTALGQDFESLIAQFDAQVQRTPERVAVVDDAETLTFAELAVLVERTASAIRSFVPHACDGNEFLVALHGPRANSTIALMLGVLKAGGAFLCLDSQSPLARNREILEDAKPSLLICAHPTEWREVLPHGIALLDLQEALSSNEVCVARHRDARPDDLMYVVYTSGSTGRPKGVMVEHRQFAGFVPGFARQCRALGMDSLDAWLINQSFTFDPALIGLALLCGGTRVVILSDAQMKEPSEILRLVERHGIAVFKTSPSLAVALVECITRREHAPHLIVGGDDTSVDALEKLQRYCEQYGRKALNAYGPTETTINCAFSVLDGQVTIGRSMPGCTAYVLGEDMSLLPRGAVGELYVGGDCVARGYLGQPDLTRKAFVESPFEEERRRVLYRTGDYVRWLDDGRLQFRGRCDEQVKVRGYRVEVEEVAQTIRATQLVHDVRVVFNAERQQLVAFVIPIAGTSSAGSDPQALHERIRCALEERLPAYMHPALYASVEAWPTTRHGKLDRQALLKTETFHAGAGIRYPAGDLELKLADVWASLLGVPLSTITTDSCFFKLGGHSLLAIQLTSRLYELFGCMLQIRHIMERSRFSELADSIRSPSKGSIAAPIVPVTDACGRFPASFSQSKFWLVDNLSESGKRFNIVMRIGLPLDCDEGLVQQALDMVVGRHEALRTHFEYSDGLLQVVQAQGQCSLTTVDLRELDPQPRRKRLEAILADEYSLIRDLRTGPLIGATLIKEPQGSHLLINLHHIVSDAWSNELLAEEVRCCYRALSLNGPIELPVLSVQYRDYSAWQHNSLHERLPSLEAYWKQRLDGLPLVHELPLDFPRPVIQSSVGAYHSQRIGRDLQRSLSTLFLDQRATLFVGLQALFSAFLARWSGQADIALGTATANRNNPDTRYLIGAFVDTVVLRSDVQQERSFTEHLIATREASLADQDHFDMPFEVLVRTLNPERNGSYSPLFQLVLNLVYSSNDILMFDGDDRDDVRHPINVNYDLTLYAKPGEKGLELTWCYASGLFKPETIARMAASFETLMSAVVAYPNRSLQSLPLAGSEVCTELAALAQGPAASRTCVLVPDLIARQARARGDAPALLLEDETLEFSALEARANQLARALVAAGVQVGDRVGVCQERTLDLLASVIGVMKAGAVYVPLDPGYPDERLAHLLVDAGIGHVLTEAHLAPQLPLSGRSVVLVSSADGQDTTAFESPVTRSSPAYMIYTSGSTGQPKGVVISHGALADKLAALAQHYELDETDRGLLFASMSFDASLSQLLVPLAVGGSVVLRPDGLTEPEALLAYVAAQRVTWMHVVPAYLRQLLEVPDWSGTVLRRVSCGGDVLDRGLQQAWFTPERAGIALYNSYGPTEITITSSSHRVQPDEAVVAIGRPLANTRYWVLDEQGQVLPRGAVGELCIGGSGLADGYWGREAQTQERFVDLEPVPGHRERLYRSGDRVRWNDAGDLEFIGRTDHQVKVRGYRIELGEVEAALQGCSGVSGAVVKVEQESLWAYVSLDSGELAQVEAELSARLPGYLLPSGYEQVEQWPLTRSGKIDRRALVRGQATPKRRAPANEVESALLEMWAALLKTDDIGVTDNFFQRGGHSLLATRLASQIRRGFEVNFTLKSLFELPSIEEQAMFIDVLAKKKATGNPGDEGTRAVEEFSL